MINIEDRRYRVGRGTVTYNCDGHGIQIDAIQGAILLQP